MKNRAHIKPSKPVAFIQMIASAAFVVIGFAVVIPMLSSHGGPVWFGFLWTGAALIGVITGAINAFSDRGISTEEIVYDTPDTQAPSSTIDRLIELERMHRGGLISPAEYTENRRKILSEH